MRYPAQYKEQARAKLIESSGRYAKQNGFINSGMADIAAAASVTTGSLYKHFNGKSDLFKEIIAAEMQRTANLYQSIDSDNAAHIADTLAKYLSMSHVQQPELGCPLPALTAEIGRADDTVKETFEQGLLNIHVNLTALTGDAATAWSVMAQNVGAVMLARAMHSKELQHELLNAVYDAGEHLINRNTPNQAAK